jgi:S-adenosyl-methyltransferase MraW
MMNFKHIPVLFEETIEGLNIRPNGVYIDGTMGGGGHSEAILKQLQEGTLLSIDQDPDAIEAAGERLQKYKGSVRIQGNFCDMQKIAHEQNIYEVDGILLDIGVSSHQLDTPERGFSYHEDAPLDMRMSKSGVSARDVVNTYSQKELSDIIFRFGEDKSANKIASAIVRHREQMPIETTTRLAEIVKESVPAAVRRAPGHPARKTFQAIRIAVNDELNILSQGLDQAFELLRSGGRIAIITFHSLEDRIVKQKMIKWSEGCVCPKDFPVCICGRKPLGKQVHKRGQTASEKELKENPRARSARLRVFEKF